MLPTTTLEAGDIVQLGPEAKNPAFRLCLMTVTEPKSFGAQGFVQALGTREGAGGRAYYRAGWEEMEPTDGRTPYMPDDGDEGTNA